MKRAFILIAMLLLSIPVLQAQEYQKHSLSLGWNAMFPSKDNFTNKATIIAPSLSWEYHFMPILSAGASIGYFYADEKGKTRDYIEGATLDGKSHRKLATLPIQLHLRYYPIANSTSIMQPFVSIGAGVQYAKFDITGDLIHTATSSNWGGVITPELGVRYQPNMSRFHLDLSGFYQYGSNKWTLLDHNKNQQYFGIRLSAGWLIF